MPFGSGTLLELGLGEDMREGEEEIFLFDEEELIVFDPDDEFLLKENVLLSLPGMSSPRPTSKTVPEPEGTWVQPSGHSSPE